MSQKGSILWTCSRSSLFYIWLICYSHKDFYERNYNTLFDLKACDVFLLFGCVHWFWLKQVQTCNESVQFWRVQLACSFDSLESFVVHNCNICYNSYHNCSRAIVTILLLFHPRNLKSHFVQSLWLYVHMLFKS